MMLVQEEAIDTKTREGRVPGPVRSLQHLI